ncbi:hypothetical protein SLA2020_290410 [Shorea laevis]
MDSESSWGKWRDVCVCGFERDGSSCGVIRRRSDAIRWLDEVLVLRRGLDFNRENREAPLLIRVLVAIDEVEGWNNQLSSAKNSSRETRKMSGLKLMGQVQYDPSKGRANGWLIKIEN